MYLLVFIVYHVWTTRFSGHFTYPVHAGGTVTEGGPLVASRSSIYYFMLADLSGNWLIGIVYLLGVFAAVFHFANGIWTFCITWGITVGESAQRISKWIFYGLGLGLLVLGTAASVIHLVTTQSPTAG